ncbi:MAG TPA: hypothetical protein HPP77_08670 [Candidatus Hydrogenedentes bacterium]|nr:hypothetical protein [Candidatus Hydrogenedentota bacterium]
MPRSTRAANAAAQLCLLAFVSVLALVPTRTASAQEPASNDEQTISATNAKTHDAPAEWYFYTGNVNVHPRLDDAEKEIDRMINRRFRLFAPGFDDIRTFSDQRDDMMIWNGLIGVGRTLSRHWDFFFQAGYAAGKVRTEATDLSIFLIPLQTDITLERSSAFVGPGLAFYPRGMSRRAKYDSFAGRLKQAKPFVATTLAFNYLTFDADVKAGFVPLGGLIRQKESRRWRPWNAGLSLGADIPLTKKTVLSTNAQYSFFFDEGGDFSGPAFNFYCKRFFGGPKRESGNDDAEDHAPAKPKRRSKGRSDTVSRTRPDRFARP